ncbi:hypothetical protein [Sinorhizobium meliloti]|uniref:hypothetical protein n=1 Tax=Rhizobium meliloti TaxID=382 RepID=UPI00129633CB|nr:hypothetical protein [Sinorhizobium meliloti]MQW57442.1 hypothetical protein [Sinorhizobium meliloti]
MERERHFANRRMLSDSLERVLLTLSGITTAFLFAWLLYYSSYGLNVEDEGFYLNFIANPFPYSINSPPSLFGYIYHWPYLWVGGDIAMLRIVNVTLTMALGWILSFLAVGRLCTVGWLQAAVLSAGIASMASIVFRVRATLTPSYYAMAFQSLLIIMIGLLVADRPGRVRQVLGWTLVGVGGWCCFMAKPTTAAAIALIVTLYVLVLRRKSLLPMLGAALVALALLIMTAHLIDGGINGLVNRLVSSAKVEILLDSRHEVLGSFRIDWLAPSRSQVAMAVLLAVALLLSILVGPRGKMLPSLALAAVLIVTIAIALLGYDPVSIQPSTLFLVPAFTCLGAMVYRKGLVLRTQSATSIALTLTFSVLPHVFALGSNLNYWDIGTLGALFWMLAAVSFLSPLAKPGRSLAALLPLTVLTQLLTASVNNNSILNPPWEDVKNLRDYTAVMPMTGGGKLVIAESLHHYLAAARAKARGAGLEVGAPVVDLTGGSPTLLYVLDARPLGLPWLTGWFPGGSAVAVETLGLENCADLAKAWVLIEPEGKYHLDHASVMASFGAGQADYVAAATFDPKVADLNYPIGRQFLLKPVRPAAPAEQSCGEARRQRPESPKWSP